MRTPGELPVPGVVLAKLRRHARAHPWPGNVPLSCPRHVLDTEAILEPGRPTRLLLSLDVGYHSSGWWKNADYERCLHLSVSHPRWDRPAAPAPVPPDLGGGVILRRPVEAPDERECWEWAKALFGPEHVAKAWVEGAASPLDPYRMPGIVHVRLFLGAHGEPIQPVGEPYQPLRVWSPKVLGTIGGDVH